MILVCFLINFCYFNYKNKKPNNLIKNFDNLLKFKLILDNLDFFIFYLDFIGQKKIVAKIGFIFIKLIFFWIYKKPCFL